jgi:hypothetical protein
MKNITLAIDEEILEASRRYARKHNTTLNALVRQLLERTVRQNSKGIVEELFRLMDKHPGHPAEGYRYRRDDAYDV